MGREVAHRMVLITFFKAAFTTYAGVRNLAPKGPGEKSVCPHPHGTVPLPSIAIKPAAKNSSDRGQIENDLQA